MNFFALMLMQRKRRPYNLTLVDSSIRQEMDIIIIGIKQKDGKMMFSPSSKTKIQSDDILIAMVRNKDLEKLRKALIPRI